MDAFKGVVNFLLITGVLHGFVFVLFPLFNKRKLGKVIFLLNCTVLFISLNNLQAWLIVKNIGFDQFAWSSLEIPWYVLVVPFFYAFLVHFMKIERQTTNYLKGALILFVLEIILRCTLIVLTISSENEQLIQRYTKWEELINAFYSVIIFITAIDILFRRHELQNFVKKFGELRWLRFFMIIGSVVMLTWISAIILGYYSDYEYGVVAYYPLRLASSILIYWIGYQGLLRYNLIENRIALKNEIVEEKPKVEEELIKTKINKDFSKDYRAIRELLVGDRIYLDPDLSIDKFADQIGLSKGSLSKIINRETAANFPDLINKFRVAFAKRLLSDPNYDAYTIVAIGLESGFNSKSTFYSAFKKFTGQSPTEYRNKKLE